MCLKMALHAEYITYTSDSNIFTMITIMGPPSSVPTIVKGHNTPHQGQSDTPPVILTWSPTLLLTPQILDTSFVWVIYLMTIPDWSGGSQILSIHHNLKWQTTIPDTVPDVVYGGLSFILISITLNIIKPDGTCACYKMCPQKQKIKSL